jgi:hypothetical protein
MIFSDIKVLNNLKELKELKEFRKELNIVEK